MTTRIGYCFTVTCHIWPLRAYRNLLPLGLLSICLAAAAQQKEIRLRNEKIVTLPKSGRTATPLAVQSPLNGLFLLQFEGQLQPSWRAELKNAGVELLKYVPEDAFIARFTNTSATTIQALNFVRWVGPYRPDHKIHP